MSVRDDRRLVRSLGFWIAVKLALLMLIWAVFLRGQAPAVDAEAVAGHLGAPSVMQTNNGGPHGR